jgi:hypothetical protein
MFVLRSPAILATAVLAGAGVAITPTPAMAVSCVEHIGYNVTDANVTTRHGNVTTYGLGNSPRLGLHYTSCDGRASLWVYVDNAGSHDYYKVPWARVGATGTWYTDPGSRRLFPRNLLHRNNTYRMQIHLCDRHWYGDDCGLGKSPVVEVSTAD